MQTPVIGLMTIPYHTETMGVQTLAHMERKTGALGNDNPFPEILMLHISFQGCNCQKVPVKLYLPRKLRVHPIKTNILHSRWAPTNY